MPEKTKNRVFFVADDDQSVQQKRSFRQSLRKSITPSMRRLKSMNLQNIRILISSPGDVDEERAKAKCVINDLGLLYDSLATLEAVFWEELALPVTASFRKRSRQPVRFRVAAVGDAW
jgi:hypothetical protein